MRFAPHNDLKHLIVLAGMATALWPVGGAQGREQYQMHHPEWIAPPSAGTSMPGGLVTRFTPDFWKGRTDRKIPVGTVLTAVLNQDLSSSKSKPGDVFELVLPDGYSVNGTVLLPPGSKILGSVLFATPAKTLRNGIPGELQINLQAMVTPDGHSRPFYGFIDHNPAQDQADQPKVRHHGASLSNYGQSLKSFFGQFGGGIGRFMNQRNQGMDFKLSKGEVLPVRLNRSLSVSDLPCCTGEAAANPAGGGLPATGLSNQPANAVPGLVGTDPEGSATTVTGSMIAPSMTNGNPNQIFEQPLRPLPRLDGPDPF